MIRQEPILYVARAATGLGVAASAEQVLWAMLHGLITLQMNEPEHPWAPGEPLLRWGLLIAAGWGFGVTGRRVLLVAMSLLFLASVVTTLILTTWGGLVGLLLAIPALYGLALSGEARLRLARDVSA